MTASPTFAALAAIVSAWNTPATGENASGEYPYNVIQNLMEPMDVAAKLVEAGDRLDRPFMVFGGDFPAEPMGGMKDLIDRFDSEAEAVAFARGFLKAKPQGWAYVHNFATGDNIDVGG